MCSRVRQNQLFKLLFSSSFYQETKSLFIQRQNRGGERRRVTEIGREGERAKKKEGGRVGLGGLTEEVSKTADPGMLVEGAT